MTKNKKYAGHDKPAAYTNKKGYWECVCGCGAYAPNECKKVKNMKDKPCKKLSIHRRRYI